MNTPNKLTISRMVLTVIFLALLPMEFAHSKLIATLIYIIAVLTDYYDGLLARKYDQFTDFGRIMDPIADKMLILGTFGMLTVLGVTNIWLVVIIVARELSVTIYRVSALRNNVVLQAEQGGKVKAGAQMIVIYTILLCMIVGETKNGRFVFGSIDLLNNISLYILMLITTMLTITSGLSFFVNNTTDLCHKIVLKFSYLFATVCNLGFSPFASGTVGSLAGLGVLFLIKNDPFVSTTIFIITFFFGVYTSNIVAKNENNSDPGIVVMDEFSCIFPAFLFIPFTWKYIIIGFIIYRLFDIFKPFPCKQLEKVPAGWGIMLDDLAAGAYTFAVLTIMHIISV